MLIFHGVDEVQHHPGYLVAIPGYLPQLRLEVRPIQPLLVGIFTLVAIAPVILKGFLASIPDLANMLRPGRANFQAFRQGIIRQVLQVRADHRIGIPRRGIAFLFGQDARSALGGLQEGFKVALARAGVPGCNLAQVLLIVVQQRPSNPSPAPFRSN